MLILAKLGCEKKELFTVRGCFTSILDEKLMCVKVRVS